MGLFQKAPRTRVSICYNVFNPSRAELNIANSLYNLPDISTATELAVEFQSDVHYLLTVSIFYENVLLQSFKTRPWYMTRVLAYLVSFRKGEQGDLLYMEP